MKPWFEPDRLEAAFWAFLGAAFIGAVSIVATAFSVPPPERRQLWRAFADFALGVFGGVIAGYSCADPAADLLNGLAAKLVPGYASIDSLAAGLLVGSIVMKLWPVMLDFIVAQLKKRVEKVA